MIERSVSWMRSSATSAEAQCAWQLPVGDGDFAARLPPPKNPFHSRLHPRANRRFNFRASFGVPRRRPRARPSVPAEDLAPSFPTAPRPPDASDTSRNAPPPERGVRRPTARVTRGSRPVSFPKRQRDAATSRARVPTRGTHADVSDTRPDAEADDGLDAAPARPAPGRGRGRASAEHRGRGFAAEQRLRPEQTSLVSFLGPRVEGVWKARVERSVGSEAVRTRSRSRATSGLVVGIVVVVVALRPVALVVLGPSRSRSSSSSSSCCALPCHVTYVMGRRRSAADRRRR